jgi:hypothetical protein
VGDHPRYRLDDIRRFGIGLATSFGLAPARASALVSGLLWYEAAGAPEFGIATLMDWIGAIESGEVDPKAEGRVGKEHTATAVLDAQRGLAPLILARAAAIAQEKAREVGVGVVRVVNLGSWGGSTAEVASEIAIGPMIGTVEGPGGSVAIGVPVDGSVPAVYDSALKRDDFSGVPPWASSPLAAWVVSARAVSAFESLASVHEHVETLLRVNPPFEGEVRPDAWQTRRRDQIEHGLPLDEGARVKLAECGARLGVTFPGPRGRG